MPHGRVLLLTPALSSVCSVSTADMAAAFPTLTKPSAKQRRVSLSDLCPAAGCAATCEADEPSPAHGGASLDKYWSDPLPLPVGLEAGLCAARGCHAGACSRPSHAAAAAAAPESDMLDTAASPASCCDAFCDGGAASPAPCAMDACPGDSPACVPPTFSPLRECPNNGLPAGRGCSWSLDSSTSTEQTSSA